MHWLRSAAGNVAQSFSISLRAAFSPATQLSTVLPELPDRSMAALHVLETSKRGIASATLITRLVPANSIAKVTLSNAVGGHKPRDQCRRRDPAFRRFQDMQSRHRPVRQFRQN